MLFHTGKVGKHFNKTISMELQTSAGLPPPQMMFFQRLLSSHSFSSSHRLKKIVSVESGSASANSEIMFVLHLSPQKGKTVVNLLQ
jgi:hypothetical protein